ncbi:GNAT family N-acetyltransferase [Streptomyces sp. NPDC087420]|uniref:GNAT family N-acetyltransferase n=1 Tax=Streptomyces sp. NPDC087420 TaxID=3365785 RepID=UPI003833A794
MSETIPHTIPHAIPHTILHAPATAKAPALTLRPWREGDVPALIEAYDDPVMARSTQNPVTSRAEAVRWLEEQSRGWATGTRLSFAVLELELELEEGRLVGHVAVRLAGWVEGAGDAAGGAGAAGAAGTADAADAAGTAGTAEVGYWTVAAARGRGVAPHALEAVTVWAFADLGGLGGRGVNRLELLHQVDNPASCRVAAKAGYRYVKTLPPHPPFPLEGHLHTRHR